jgi:hypothetical protein
MSAVSTHETDWVAAERVGWQRRTNIWREATSPAGDKVARFLRPS